MSSKKPLRLTNLGPGDLPHHNDPQTLEDDPEIDDQDWIEWRLRPISEGGDFIEELMDNTSSIKQMENLIDEICIDIRKTERISINQLHYYGASLYAIVMALIAMNGDVDDFYKWMEERNEH